MTLSLGPITLLIGFGIRGDCPIIIQYPVKTSKVTTQKNENISTNKHSRNFGPIRKQQRENTLGQEIASCS